jgi:hypothetical protein
MEANKTPQTCSKCQIEKPLHDFYFRKDNKKHRTECKKCHLKQKHVYHVNNKNLKDQYNRKYYLKNKDKFISYTRNKRKENINWRLRIRYSNYIRKVLKSNNINKNFSSSPFLGCSIPDFKLYLENKFKEGMSWDNWGFGDDKWHIDHIIPCASFDLTDPQQQRKCFHYTNMQPLWQKENLSKGNRIIAESNK